METSEDPADRLARLYGGDLARDRGVLHCVATWRAPDATLRVIKIGPGAPDSETDLFALRAARMRADALVTTGAILREEPDVEHRERNAALLRWRRERVGREAPPRSVVLTSGRDLDADHPLFASAHEPLIATGNAAAERLRETMPGVEVVGRDEPGIRDTVALLRERGCQTVLIEAGPSTARSLYDAPLLVDELLLSVFEGPELAEDRVGPELLEPGRIESLLERRSGPVRMEEPSGPWSFHRFTRRRVR